MNAEKERAPAWGTGARGCNSVRRGDDGTTPSYVAVSARSIRLTTPTTTSGNPA
jgi:hypothetical protein